MVKNRLHLDLKLTGGPRVLPDYRKRKAIVDTEVERLVGLGASIAHLNAPRARTTTPSPCATPRGTSSASCSAHPDLPRETRAT